MVKISGPFSFSVCNKKGVKWKLKHNLNDPLNSGATADEYRSKSYALLELPDIALSIRGYVKYFIPVQSGKGTSGSLLDSCYNMAMMLADVTAEVTKKKLQE